MNTQLRTEHIEMDVQNDKRGLLPGMFAQVSLSFQNAQKTFVVPASAIAGNSQQVFVIRDANGKAQWVNIRKGRERPDSVEVYGDLHPNDRLVLKASDEIRDGAVL
jgi:multidrug efflux pump subunit AcrA (membrane-fusion protein)